MKYLKTFENFSEGGDWISAIENNEYYEEIKKLVENEPDVIMAFDALVSKIQSADIKMIEPLFHDFELASELLGKELSTYRMESLQNIDTRQMATHALKYIAGLGILSALVKVFYVAGRYAFENLDELGVGSIAGGVLVILLYLAVFGSKGNKSKSKNLNRKGDIAKDVASDDGYTEYEEL